MANRTTLSTCPTSASSVTLLPSAPELRRGIGRTLTWRKVNTSAMAEAAQRLEGLRRRRVIREVVLLAVHGAGSAWRLYGTDCREASHVGALEPGVLDEPAHQHLRPGVVSAHEHRHPLVADSLGSLGLEHGTQRVERLHDARSRHLAAFVLRRGHPRRKRLQAGATALIGGVDDGLVLEATALLDGAVSEGSRH